MKTIKVLGLCGSLRKASTNMGLLRYARAHAPEGMEVAIADLSEVPFFNQDLEKLEERPAAVTRLYNQLEEADALLLACPEYNYSMAPALKNVLDWASRAKDNRLLAGKPVAILGSGGGLGSARAQYHLRQTCVYLDLHPLNKPEIFAKAFGGGFDDKGNPTDESVQTLIRTLLDKLQDWTEMLSTPDE
ncbi:MAG: NAD(P)H-dependent oxidoreductase [Desulfuromonas sp.]|nr:MAG: NAD(P)H-dependent oxidoreductase [Desulfuromonas sp.]